MLLMQISLSGLKEIWHLFLFQFLKVCQTPCHNKGWLKVFQLKFTVGKCWFSGIRKFLWEYACSVKIFSESKAMWLSVLHVSQPSYLCGSTQWELQTVCAVLKLLCSLLSSSCAGRKTFRFDGQTSSLSVYMQNYQFVQMISGYV